VPIIAIPETIRFYAVLPTSSEAPASVTLMPLRDAKVLKSDSRAAGNFSVPVPLVAVHHSSFVHLRWCGGAPCSLIEHKRQVTILFSGIVLIELSDFLSP
jgi:hypothetical protein